MHEHIQISNQSIRLEPAFLARSGIFELKPDFSLGWDVGEWLPRDWRLLGQSETAMVYGLRSLLVILRSAYVRKYVHTGILMLLRYMSGKGALDTCSR